MKSWTDLDVMGKRLTRLIRKLEKQFNKSASAYEKVNIANAISSLSKQCVELAKIHLKIKDTLEAVTKKYDR